MSRPWMPAVCIAAAPVARNDHEVPGLDVKGSVRAPVSCISVEQDTRSCPARASRAVLVGLLRLQVAGIVRSRAPSERMGRCGCDGMLIEPAADGADRQLHSLVGTWRYQLHTVRPVVRVAPLEVRAPHERR